MSRLLQNPPIPCVEWATVVAVAEQGEAGVYVSSQASAVLQHAAHLVSRLVETNTMAELSPGANITGLACLLCVYGPIAEIASLCNDRNVGGAAATCFVAILAAAACPLWWPGLQDAEDPAFLPPRAPSLLPGGVAKGKTQPIQRGVGTTLENRRGGKILPPPPQSFSYLGTTLSQI